MSAAAARKLEVVGLRAGYGKKEVVRGLDLHLDEGEVLVVLGHNGAGKTTSMSALFGLLQPRAGHVRFEG
ncbi:MAG TPA: ATP-binding cassette domain-containing protein, partial [Alphaproteobacteria bacterium]|nr:ATP-binding cassette domain-containing protein [Alphaproteobacteria bacterium]